MVAGIILLPILAHIGYAVANSTMLNYYVTVDEYALRSATTPVRVGGQVIPGSIEWNNAARTMRFQIAGDSAKIDVVYKGMVPDSFRDGATVILEGSRSAGNTFAATSVSVKCPHQYLPSG